MYTFSLSMYTLPTGPYMTMTQPAIVHKHFRLDQNKLKKAQAVFQASTETETVERALDLSIEEHKRNQIVARAHRDFLKSGIEIRDVFGSLED